MTRVRALRRDVDVKACTGDAEARTILADQQREIGAILPDLPNERLVYACENRGARRRPRRRREPRRLAERPAALWRARYLAGAESMIRKLLVVLRAALRRRRRSAEWHEATSRNFIVYSEGSEQDAREFAGQARAVQLRAARLSPGHRRRPAPNRLRVFLMAERRRGRAHDGGAGSGIAGYYVPATRAG